MDWTKKLEEYRIEAESSPVNDFRENIEKNIIIPKGIKGFVNPSPKYTIIPSAFNDEIVAEYIKKYRKIDLAYMVENAKNKRYAPTEKTIRRHMDNMTKYVLVITYLKLIGRNKQI